DLTQLRIDAFNGIGRVDHSSYIRWEGEEGNDLLPSPLPAGCDHRILLAPGALGECLQRLLGSVSVNRAVDRAQRRTELLSVLPVGIAHAATDQVHDARL